MPENPLHIRRVLDIPDAIRAESATELGSPVAHLYQIGDHTLPRRNLAHVQFEKGRLTSIVREIEGYPPKPGIQLDFDPGALTVFMQVDDTEKNSVPKFCMIREERTYLDIKTGKTFSTTYLTFPQEHIGVTATSTHFYEEISDAGKRALKEETGIEFNGDGDILDKNRVRDSSTGPSTYSVVFFEGGSHSFKKSFQDLEPTEVITVEWHTFDEIYAMQGKKEFRDDRTSAVVSIIGAFLQNDPRFKDYYLDVITRNYTAEDLRKLADVREALEKEQANTGNPIE